MEALVLQKKMSSINISNAKTKFCWSLHYSHNNNYLLVNGKEIFKFKANNKNINSPTQVCLGSISNRFWAIDSREVSLKGNVYDFSVDFDAIDKSQNMFHVTVNAN